MQFAENEVWFIIIGFTVVMLFIICIFAFVIITSRKRKLKHLNEIAEEKIKLQQAQLAKKDAIIEERNRIIADLHDDVGATLSSMHIYGDLAGNVWDTQPAKSKEMVSKMSQQSKELMVTMNDIVWSLKLPQAEKNSFLLRIKDYSRDLLAAKSIAVDISIDETVDAAMTNPMARKNLLLIVKEAVNNIAKYSGATHVIIKLQQQNDMVALSVSDNGKGLPADINRQGNGLANMQQRCRQLNGLFKIDSAPGAGVTITCNIPVTIISHLS
jgi:signal transduction histidine kinase